MPMKRILVWVLTALVLASVHPIEAQQAGKVPRIGFLSGSGDPANPANSETAFRQALHDLGYVEGKNIVLEIRYARGKRDRVPLLSINFPSLLE